MKNTFLVIIVLVLLFLVSRQFLEKDQNNENQLTKSSRDTNSEYQSEPAYEIKIISDISKIKLISNLSEQKPTFEIAKDCQFLVNGGFYSKEDEHIGLFISEYEKLSPYRGNATFNGFLYFDKNEIPIVSENPPENTRVAIQSGPVIKLDSVYQKLAISNDKKARRVVAAVTDSGELAFLIIYQNNSRLYGPELAKLPQVLERIEEEESINFLSVINLDGGAASAFYDGETKFVESSTIGSYFCLN